MSNFFIFGLLTVSILVSLAYRNLLSNFVKLLNIRARPGVSMENYERSLEIARKGMTAALMYQFAMVLTIPVSAIIFTVVEPSSGRWIGLLILPVYIAQIAATLGPHPSVDWEVNKDKKIRLYNTGRHACLINVVLLGIITGFTAVNRLNIF